MEFKGRITQIFDTERGVSADGYEWVSKDVEITETGREYPESIVVRLKAKVAEGFSLNVGDEARALVAFHARHYVDKEGRERGRTDVSCWEIGCPAT